MKYDTAFILLVENLLNHRNLKKDNFVIRSNLGPTKMLFKCIQIGFDTLLCSNVIRTALNTCILGLGLYPDMEIRRWMGS